MSYRNRSYEYIFYNIISKNCMQNQCDTVTEPFKYHPIKKHLDVKAKVCSII